MVNARTQTTPAGTDTTVSRATIFDSFGNSIRDIPGVASVTARSQLVTNLTNTGQGPTAARPLVVHRADARGLHRIEYTTNGTVWMPASGVLDFTSKSAADSWATSNSGLLSRGDECAIPNARLFWDGAKWVGGPPIGIDYVSGGIYSSSSTSPAQIRADRGYASFEGRVASTAANFVAGTTYKIGDVPTGYRPAKEETYAVAAKGSTFARLTITTSGEIFFSVNATFNETLDLGLAPINYRIA